MNPVSTKNPTAKGNVEVENSVGVTNAPQGFEAEYKKMVGEYEAALASLEIANRENVRLALENVQLSNEKAKAEKMAEEAKEMAMKAEEGSRIDVLTELPNLKFYNERVAIEISQASRHQYPLTMMMIDIDDFKMINDTRGHNIGDSVIRKMADIVSRNLRIGDFMARIGGEEFVILLPHLNVEQAAKVAKKIKDALRDELKDEAVKFTISGGFAPLGSEFNTPEALKNAADTALYQAKAKGKNRIFEYDKARVVTKTEIKEIFRQRTKRVVPKELSLEEVRNVYQSLADEITSEIQKKVAV